jgi:hypothetical protein
VGVYIKFHYGRKREVAFFTVLLIFFGLLGAAQYIYSGTVDIKTKKNLLLFIDE